MITRRILWLILAAVLIGSGCSSGDDGGEMEEMSGDQGMSSMDMDMPEDLDTRTSKETDNGLFQVSVTSNIDPLIINEINSWTVHVADSDGEPIEGAVLAVGGGMPQHNHGFPTEPQITEELGDGDYLLEGVKFNMAGWWELKLDVEAGGETDTVVFNIILK